MICLISTFYWEHVYKIDASSFRNEMRVVRYVVQVLETERDLALIKLLCHCHCKSARKNNNSIPCLVLYLLLFYVDRERLF